MTRFYIPDLTHYQYLLDSTSRNANYYKEVYKNKRGEYLFLITFYNGKGEPTNQTLTGKCSVNYEGLAAAAAEHGVNCLVEPVPLTL